MYVLGEGEGDARVGTCASTHVQRQANIVIQEMQRRQCWSLSSQSMWKRHFQSWIMHAHAFRMSSWALCVVFCSRVLSNRFPKYFGVVVWSQTPSVLGHVKSLRWIRWGPRKSLAFAIKPHAEKELEVTLKLLLGGSHSTSFMTQLINLWMFAISQLVRRISYWTLVYVKP